MKKLNPTIKEIDPEIIHWVSKALDAAEIPKDKRSEYAKRILTWSRDYTAVAKAHLRKKSRKEAITCKDLRTLVPGKRMLVAKLQGWLQHDQKPEWLKEKA